MKIVNKTHWDTAPLRKLVARIAQDECEPEKRKRLRVEVVPARRRYSNGFAYVGGTYSRIRVPNPHRVEWTNQQQIDLASLIAHELAHNHGHSGERWMRAKSCVRYGRRSDEQAAFYAWALSPEYMMRPREKKLVVKPGPDDKLDKAQERLASWERKAKYAANKIRKYRLRVRYYERKMAARDTCADAAVG